VDVTVGDESMPLREYAKREKLARIQDAARHLLSSRTIAEITMRDVARAARVGEATLFRYVGSKEQLLLLVFEGQMERQLAEIEGDPRFSPDDHRTGVELVETICEIFRRRGEMYVGDPANVTDYVRVALVPDNVIGELGVSHGDRTRQIVAALIADGQRRKVLSADWSPAVLADNCAGIYIHEILRSPVRGFPATTFLDRLEQRLRVQLEPLVKQHA
jgi:AcrR family transcriptional regulator